MSLKRAKWVEGITTSKRILRDISEIVTTAIQDASGPVAGENWELIFPRPFEESDVVRGALVVDANDDKKFIPNGSMTETIKLNGTTGVVLKNKGVIESSVVVKSLNGAVTYVAGTDYTYTASICTLVCKDGGAILSGAEVIVEYAFTFNKILDTVPVVVEKKLTTPEADRLIDESKYTINYSGKYIQFNVEPPKAESFLLTFTERTGVYTQTDHTKLELEKDILDPTGRKYKLPAGYGEILKEYNYREIASSTSGASATGEAPYILDPVAKKVTFATAPSLATGANADKLYWTGREYDSAATAGTHDVIRAELTPDPGDTTGTVFVINGVTFDLNQNEAHKVELYTVNQKIELYQHLNAADAGYDIVDPADYVVSYDNPAINFITTPAVGDEFVVSFKARDAVDLQIGLNKITDRVVLKTTVKPDNVITPVPGRDYGAADTATELTMYVEIFKPKKLINPETGLERYTDHRGVQIPTQDNNHFIQVRMFDKWDDALQAPAKEKRDPVTGAIIEKAAEVSNWSKYAWFQDWKEYLVDEVDDDPGFGDVKDGIIFKEVTTKGMSDEFPVQFWISTNNNRIAMVLMGDPTLDQDHFLTSFAYIGRIQPFYDTKYQVRIDEVTGECVKDADGNPIIDEVREYFENDVSGNFAMTVGSSTLPADIGIPPTGQAVLNGTDVGVNTDPATGSMIPGELYDSTVYVYAVTYLTEGGESKPTPIGNARRFVVNPRTVNPANPSMNPTKGLSIKLKFTLPDEATGYRIYRYHYSAPSITGALSNVTYLTNVEKHQYYKMVANVTKLGLERNIEFVDDGTGLTMVDPVLANSPTASPFTDTSVIYYSKFTSTIPTARSFESVVRDKFTGAIISVKFPSKFGDETGTGVNDITMFKTRSGLKYQRHYASFITTEEFIRKEKSGQSRWTGKFHLSPVYVEHSYDKQRGWLDGVMVVDDSGIAHLDELIVDKDTPKEEVYKFFRVNAPFSFFNNSPNHAYGVAIIKSSMRWT